MRVKMSKPPPPAPIASTIGPCPTAIQIVGRPGHWKFTQHHRTTRPPQLNQWTDFITILQQCSLGDLLPTLPAEAIFSNILCYYESQYD